MDQVKDFSSFDAAVQVTGSFNVQVVLREKSVKNKNKQDCR